LQQQQQEVPEEALTLVYTGRKSDQQVEVGLFDLIMPSREGSYEITFNVSLATNSERSRYVSIIPLVTVPLKAIAAEALSTTSGPLLSCRRRFSALDVVVTIEEEYGAALGSHVYDAAIATLDALPSIIFPVKATGVDAGGGDQSVFCFEDTKAKKGVVVELGSGCGLIGIWLSRFYDKVFLTDKEYQLQHLRKNVSINSNSGAAVEEETCLVRPLDWTSMEQLQALKSEIATLDTALNLVIGTDVLYDKQAAIAFFQVVRELAVSEMTTVLVAQKLREGSEPLDVSLFVDPSFLCRVHYESAHVRVFVMFRKAEGVKEEAKEWVEKREKR